MSPKQWLALCCVYISYLFFGASMFYHIEHTTELENRAAQLEERIAVNELLVKYASPEDQQIQNKVLQTLSDYCGRPVTNYTLDQYPVDYEWTFFHSFWFSFIVCSTVGYGNSSPHDQPGQAFLIFYALIGLPLNGFVLAYLGEFFSKTFTSIYKRYEGHHEHSDTNHTIEKFGMIGTIAMFLVPGIAFFIFLPACLFTYFEDWPYVRSVYYSFVTLTTIGFGDFVPTFQDGQARTFGTYFSFYQAFIVVWNFIGVGYFLMIIGFIAKGMHSKRVARLEHQLSLNIKETQNRIWTEVTKDVHYLRRILNEANMMKFRPVYTDPMERETFHSLRRPSSCPQISMYRNDDVPMWSSSSSRQRAYSESCGRLRSLSSDTTLNRSQSDGYLSRIDKEKTFEGSGSLFHTKDLLSNVLTALGSIRPMNEDDVQSCLEIYSCEPEQTDSLYEWTWDGNNSEQMKDYVKKKTIFPSKFESTKHSETLDIQMDPEMRSEPLNRSFISRFNPFKDRSMSQESRRSSMISQESNVQKYLENTSKGRGSRLSSCQLSTENMELLQNTSIADLIRAVEGTQFKTNVSPYITPLLEEYNDTSAIKPRTGPTTTDVRRESLRPVHDYTTIFTSQNTNTNRQPALTSRPLIINSSSTSTPKRIRRRIRSTSSSIPTVQEHYSTKESFPMLCRTQSLRPTMLPKNIEVTSVNTSSALPQMPIITVQAPNVSRRSLLWHPEYQDASTLQDRMRRKRADSN